MSDDFNGFCTTDRSVIKKTKYLVIMEDWYGESECYACRNLADVKQFFEWDYYRRKAKAVFKVEDISKRFIK